jgi:hypothetical protein
VVAAACAEPRVWCVVLQKNVDEYMYPDPKLLLPQLAASTGPQFRRLNTAVRRPPNPFPLACTRLTLACAPLGVASRSVRLLLSSHNALLRSGKLAGTSCQALLGAALCCACCTVC